VGGHRRGHSGSLRRGPRAQHRSECVAARGDRRRPGPHPARRLRPRLRLPRAGAARERHLLHALGRGAGQERRGSQVRLPGRDMARARAAQKQMSRQYDRALDRATFRLSLVRATQLPEEDRPWLAMLLGMPKREKIDEAAIRQEARHLVRGAVIRRREDAARPANERHTGEARHLGHRSRPAVALSRRRGAQAQAGAARGQSPRQPGVNGHAKRRVSRCSCQRGVNECRGRFGGAQLTARDS
jgi:hypothetical protein